MGGRPGRYSITPGDGKASGNARRAGWPAFSPRWRHATVCGPNRQTSGAATTSGACTWRHAVWLAWSAAWRPV